MLMENAKQTKNNAYERVIEDKDYARFIQRAHQTMISNGTELEHIINKSYPNTIIKIKEININLNEFPIGTLINGCEIIIDKRFVSIDKNKIHKKKPDYLYKKSKNEWFIIELKDGDGFDTKKSPGEVRVLQEVVDTLKKKYPDLKFIPKMVLFNNKNLSEASIKCLAAQPMLMRGIDFCKLLGLTWDQIDKQRKFDRKQNTNYFEEEVIKKLITKYGKENLIIKIKI